MTYVMLIDDDQGFANAMAKILRHWGYEVETSFDVSSAVKRMEQKRPALVILDVMFGSSSDGFHLAREIGHRNEKLKGIPVLVLTAVNTRFPLGFSAMDIDEHWFPVADFLEKPVDFGVLRERITALLQRSQHSTADEVARGQHR